MPGANTFFAFLSALGLSLSAGLRAYLPLLIVSAVSDVGPIDGVKVTLRPEFAWLGWPVVLVVLGLLSIYEISADKIPVIDHLNDAVHTLIRPISGAILFDATTNSLNHQGMVGLVLAGLLGAGIAGATHAAKSGIVRPASSAFTLGLANPIISFIEDAMVLVMVALAIIAPIIAGVLFIVSAAVIIWGLNAVFRRKRARRSATT